MTCAHVRTSGEWLSAAHVSRCLGVPNAELLDALATGRVRYRVVGAGHKRNVQAWAADLPRCFSGFSAFSPQKTHVMGSGPKSSARSDTTKVRALHGVWP